MTPAIHKVRADLAYRLPGSGKPLAYVVLTREEAERLMAEFDQLATAVRTLIESDEELAKARTARRQQLESKNAGAERQD